MNSALNERKSSRVYTKRPPIERFMEKVEMGECWMWVGATRGSRQKRGCFWSGEKVTCAVRWIYSHENPDDDITDKVVMHTCDVPLCVNPNHLRSGTQAENVADMWAKGRANLKGMTEGGKKGRAIQRDNPDVFVFGDAHGKTKISDRDAQVIRNSDVSTKILAEKYGVNRTTIQRIRRGATRLRALAEEG